MLAYRYNLASLPFFRTITFEQTTNRDRGRSREENLWGAKLKLASSTCVSLACFAVTSAANLSEERMYFATSCTTVRVRSAVSSSADHPALIAPLMTCAPQRKTSLRNGKLLVSLHSLLAALTD